MSDGRDETLVDIARPLEGLKSYLVADIKAGSPRSVDPRHVGALEATNVRVAVTNTAPDVRSPRVVFIGVSLSVADLRNRYIDRPTWAQQVRIERSSTSVHEPMDDLRVNYQELAGEEFPEKTSAEEKLGEVLFPGETVTYELDVPADELPCVQFRVEGSVSRRHLMYLQRELSPPEAITRPPILKSIREYNEVDLHAAFDSVVAALPSFGPQTTLVDTKTLAATLQQASAATEVTWVTMNEVFLNAPHPSIRRLVRRASLYVIHFGDWCSLMQGALVSSDLDSIAETAKHITQSRLEAKEVNGETESFLEEYSFSDDEAGYRYRGYFAR